MPRPAPLRTALEPRRLQILQMIWDREATVSEIAESLPVSIAAVSQHLARLRDAGLVQVRREGRYRHYRASREDMGTIAVVLESFWSDRLDALAEMAQTMERASHPSEPAAHSTPTPSRAPEARRSDGGSDA